MALEYVLILVLSTIILIGSFGVDTGPLKMFGQSSPKLAHQLERRMSTGYYFFERTSGQTPVMGWKR